MRSRRRILALALVVTLAAAAWGCSQGARSSGSFGAPNGATFDVSPFDGATFQ